MLDIFDNQLLDGLQFCSKAYSLFEKIRSEPNGSSRLRMRESEVEKRLLEEILPICKYIQCKYRAGRYLSVRWINGSQQYDAAIVQSGEYINQEYFPANAFLEVTCVMHPNEYLNRELLNTEGVAFGVSGIRRLKSKKIESIPFIHTNSDFIWSFSQLICDRIQKKNAIKYPLDTSLIVQCTLNTLYTSTDWIELEKSVRKGLEKTQFREVFIYDEVSELTFSL